jgi:prepilin-type N-terminal cleavage/methylation domain-containing protein
VVPERIRLIGTRGFSIAELLVVVVVIGVLAAVTAPMLVSYWKAATLKAGAQELATLLNGARQLAIRDNTSVCVAQSGTQVRYLTGASPCSSGTVWTGPGTDANGWFKLSNDVEVTATTANVVFAYLGNATTAGAYTVRNPVDSKTLTVTVATSGRVTIGP